MELLRRLEQDDPVGELLRSVRVRSTLWCRSLLSAPWGFAVETRRMPSFHLVLSGQGWLEVDGETEQRRLRAGELVVLPHGHAHAVRDDPATAVAFLDDILARTPAVGGILSYGGGGEPTEILCGALSLEGRRVNPLLAALPPVVHATLDGVAPTLDLLRDELASQEPGAAAMAARLADVLLLHALRGTVTAHRDSLLAPALRLVNDHPERPWTVGELAAHVALSRSAFTERFRRATGEAPMRYVNRVRLSRAAEYLRTNDATLAEIAAACGYGSEFSFSKAFKRAFGIAPGRYRRTADEL